MFFSIPTFQQFTDEPQLLHIEFLRVVPKPLGFQVCQHQRSDGVVGCFQLGFV